MSNDGKRVAWVTGGGSGIGEAGAEALAAEFAGPRRKTDLARDTMRNI
jgi:NAD(P)-dependent dehydrogenase (short-subunit alcohol dehydrogenase family)